MEQFSDFFTNLLSWFWSVLQIVGLAVIGFWVTCANDGWGLFLGLEIVVIAVLFGLIIVLNLIGIDVNQQQWLIASIICFPFAVMFIYQVFQTYKKLRERNKET